jgi:serine/tyrosine/threonine adenylyltransferase
MLREYLIAEAMHGLGIPTTRALAVVATGEGVFRDRALPGAVLTRIAASHLRVGTFQYAAASGDRDLLRALADHTIVRHYPEAAHGQNR